MAKVLITGSNGFLGSHLARCLLADGHEIYCLVRRTSNRRWIEQLDVKFVYGDITAEPESLPDAVRNKDYIFHTAAAVKAESRDRFFKINVTGTVNLLEACLTHNPSLKRFIFISSQAAGRPSENRVPVKESDPPAPVSDYGWSKMEAEKAVRYYFDQVPITIIRPPAIYGPHDRSFLPVFKLIKKGIRLGFGKEKILNLGYVEDVARGAVLAAEHPEAVGETFNIAPEQAYEWDHVLKTAAEIMRVKTVEIRVPKPLAMLYAYASTCFSRLRGKISLTSPSKMREMLQPYWISDTAKARRMFGCIAQHSLQQGLEKTIQWYREQDWL